jgi:hypothetical protein
MRGGGTRTEYRSQTPSGRRRRERYSREPVRDPWGPRRDILAASDEDWQDDETDSPC